MPDRFHFTKKDLASLRPAEKPYRVNDSEEKGLQCEVSPDGSKRYVYRLTRCGVTIQRGIGPVDDVPLPRAREQAHELRKAHQAGELGTGATTTLAALWKEFQRRRLPELQPRTREEYTRSWAHLQRLEKRRLDAIGHKHVVRLHDQVTQKSGPYAANRAVALLSSMYGKARRWGLWTGPAPTDAVELNPETRRDRWLTRDEIRRFWQATAKEDALWRDFFRVLLLTGARLHEVKTMRWEDLDLHRATWTHRQKGGRVMITPLPSPAAEIVAARPEVNEYVFPGWRGAAHIASPGKAWRRVCARAKIENATPHTLRHTFASWQAQQGTSLSIVGRSLGHSQASTTERYAHLDINPVRQSVDATVGAMLEGVEDAC